MHGGFSRWKLLLRRLRVVRIKPLCVPNKDHNKNMWDHAASEIYDTSDLLRSHPPGPHALLLPLHSRSLHLPSVTALPSHKLQRRSLLHRSHAPSHLMLPKSLHHALQVILPRLARLHRHHSLPPRALPPQLHLGSLHDRPRPPARRKIFPPPR